MTKPLHTAVGQAEIGFGRLLVIRQLFLSGCILTFSSDLVLVVSTTGWLSGEQRFYKDPVAFRFPMLFSGVADVCEWYDDAKTL